MSPARSKAQARYMRAVASGSVKKAGLSKKQAREYVAGQSTKNLPERAKKKAAKKRGG